MVHSFSLIPRRIYCLTKSPYLWLTCLWTMVPVFSWDCQFGVKTSACLPSVSGSPASWDTDLHVVESCLLSSGSPFCFSMPFYYAAVFLSLSLFKQVSECLCFYGSVELELKVVMTHPPHMNASNETLPEKYTLPCYSFLYSWCSS